MCRRRLEKTRLDKYSDSASFFSDSEKLINELKSVGAQLKEKKKLNYVLNTLPEEYGYIGVLIDALKEEDKIVAYVKNNIEIAEKKNKSDQGEMKTNVFAAKKGGSFICGRVGHFVRERQNGVQAASNNGCRRKSTRGRGRGRVSRDYMSRRRGNFHRQSAANTSEQGKLKILLCNLYPVRATQRI